MTMMRQPVVVIEVPGAHLGIAIEKSIQNLEANGYRVVKVTSEYVDHLTTRSK